MHQLSEGNEKSFKFLFETYRGRLFHYIYNFVKSEQPAEELVMDVFMKIWIGREMATQIENFDAFLFRVARNKSIDFLRSAAKDGRMRELLCDKIETSTDAKADSVLLLHEYEEKIRQAISLLSPRRKKVFQLSREQDFSHDQIAAKLNISKSTVNNHIVESQRFIRSYLVDNFGLIVVIFLIVRR